VIEKLAEREGFEPSVQLLARTTVLANLPLALSRKATGYHERESHSWMLRKFGPSTRPLAVRLFRFAVSSRMY